MTEDKITTIQNMFWIHTPRESGDRNITFLARKSGCLCSPVKRLTGTSSNSTPFSWRQVSTRVVHVDIGSPYSFKPILIWSQKERERHVRFRESEKRFVLEEYFWWMGKVGYLYVQNSFDVWVSSMRLPTVVPSWTRHYIYDFSFFIFYFLGEGLLQFL